MVAPNIQRLMDSRDAAKAPAQNAPSAAETAMGGYSETSLKLAQDQQASMDRVSKLMETSATQNNALITSLTPEMKALVGKQVAISDQNMALSNDLNARGKKYVPVEDRLIADTLKIGDQEAAAGTAKADIDQQYDSALNSTKRSMIAQGINPNDARYTDMMLSSSGQHAADAAGATTTARRNALKEGVIAETNTMNIGRGITSDAVSAAGAASNGLNSSMSGYNNLINAGANQTAALSSSMNGYGQAMDASSKMFETQANLTSSMAKTRADEEQNRFNNNLLTTQTLSGMSPEQASAFSRTLGVTDPTKKVQTGGLISGYGVSGAQDFATYGRGW